MEIAKITTAVPLKIQQTLDNITVICKNTGMYDHRNPECRGPKCFLEQYVVDHRRDLIYACETADFNIAWSSLIDDPTIMDLGRRLHIHKYGQDCDSANSQQQKNGNYLAAIYCLNDDPRVTLEKFKETVISMY